MALTSTRPKAAAVAAGSAKSPRDIIRNAIVEIELLESLQPAVIEAELMDLVGTRGIQKIVRLTKVLTGIVSKPVPAIPAPQPKRTRAKPSTLPQAFTDQAASARQTFVAQEAVIPAGVLRQKLGCTRQALSKAVRAHRLFTVDIGSERLYPAFYADPALDRRKLERVAKELGELPGWSKWQFFTTPKASLGGVTPLDALKQGRYTETRRAAIGFLER